MILQLRRHIKRMQLERYRDQQPDENDNAARTGDDALHEGRHRELLAR